MDCSPPSFSVHRILQARILEWVAVPFSRGSSQPRDQIWVSCVTGGFFTTSTTWEPRIQKYISLNLTYSVWKRWVCGTGWGMEWVLWALVQNPPRKFVQERLAPQVQTPSSPLARWRWRWGSILLSALWKITFGAHIHNTLTPWRIKWKLNPQTSKCHVVESPYYTAFLINTKWFWYKWFGISQG